MESFVQLSIEEYENLKQRAEQQDIPVDIDTIGMFGSPQLMLSMPARIRIDMRQLKLQICKQNDINPDSTHVEFY